MTLRRSERPIPTDIALAVDILLDIAKVPRTNLNATIKIIAAIT